MWDKVTAEFLESGPLVMDRSSEAVRERFKKMKETYQYIP